MKEKQSKLPETINSLDFLSGEKKIVRQFLKEWYKHFGTPFVISKDVSDTVGLKESRSKPYICIKDFEESK